MSGNSELRTQGRGVESAAPAHGGAARAVWAAATAVFVLAVPIALTLAAVRFAFSWQPVYTYAITAYDGEQATGIPTAQLLAATHGVRNYFSNGRRDLDITVMDRTGRREPLFNEREIAHMRDVKALVGRAYLLLDGAVLVVVLYAVASFSFRSDAMRRVAGAVLAGSLLTGALIVAFGVASLAGFDRLFTEFHVLSFSNDFWELDPARDHLVQMFPLGFWFDVTMFVGLIALLAALVLAALSATVMFAARRRLLDSIPGMR